MNKKIILILLAMLIGLVSVVSANEVAWTTARPLNSPTIEVDESVVRNSYFFYNFKERTWYATGAWDTKVGNVHYLYNKNFLEGIRTIANKGYQVDWDNSGAEVEYDTSNILQKKQFINKAERWYNIIYAKTSTDEPPELKITKQKSEFVRLFPYAIGVGLYRQAYREKPVYFGDNAWWKGDYSYGQWSDQLSLIDGTETTGPTHDPSPISRLLNSDGTYKTFEEGVRMLCDNPFTNGVGSSNNYYIYDHPSQDKKVIANYDCSSPVERVKFIRDMTTLFSGGTLDTTPMTPSTDLSPYFKVRSSMSELVIFFDKTNNVWWKLVNNQPTLVNGKENELTTYISGSQIRIVNDDGTYKPFEQGIKELCSPRSNLGYTREIHWYDGANTNKELFVFNCINKVDRDRFNQILTQYINTGSVSTTQSTSRIITVVGSVYNDELEYDFVNEWWYEDGELLSMASDQPSLLNQGGQPVYKDFLEGIHTLCFDEQKTLRWGVKDYNCYENQGGDLMTDVINWFTAYWRLKHGLSPRLEENFLTRWESAGLTYENYIQLRDSLSTIQPTPTPPVAPTPVVPSTSGGGPVHPVVPIQISPDVVTPSTSGGGADGSGGDRPAADRTIGVQPADGTTAATTQPTEIEKAFTKALTAITGWR